MNAEETKLLAQIIEYLFKAQDSLRRIADSLEQQAKMEAKAKVEANIQTWIREACVICAPAIEEGSIVPLRTKSGIFYQQQDHRRWTCGQCYRTYVYTHPPVDVEWKGSMGG